MGISQEEKTARIRDVVERMREGSLLVMRSAHSLRKLLYPVVEPTALYDVVRGNPDAKFTLEPLIQVHPWNKVVNSIVVARVERRKVRN